MGVVLLAVLCLKGIDRGLQKMLRALFGCLLVLEEEKRIWNGRKNLRKSLRGNNRSGFRIDG